jgi:hypothetical protein
MAPWKPRQSEEVEWERGSDSNRRPSGYEPDELARLLHLAKSLDKTRPSLHSRVTHKRWPPKFKGCRKLERAEGVEPSSPAWEAGVLPLNYTRNKAGPLGYAHGARAAQTHRSGQPGVAPRQLRARVVKDRVCRVHKQKPRRVTKTFRGFMADLRLTWEVSFRASRLKRDYGISISALS